MKIYTKSVFQMTAVIGEYLLVSEDWYEYEGLVARACFGGASSAEKSISESQKQMMTTLQNNYGQMFKGQTGILSSLQNAAAPILAAGINQYGFSKPEDAALRTQADEGTAASYQKAKQALGAQLSGVGGGDVYLPSGTEAGLNANIDVQAAADQANKQLGITEAGYTQGRQNYAEAAGLLGNVSAQMNPLGYAGSANNAGGEAFSDASAITQEDQAGWQTVAGVLGGAATGFLSGFGSSLGKKKG